MTYIKDQKNFEQLTRFAEDPSHSYLVVTGESGVGKSAFLANWAKENEHGEHFSVIPFFLSNGGNQPYSSILSYVSEEMVERFGLSPVTEDVKEPMTKLLDQFSVRDDRLVIVIDAINQIADVEQAKRLNWLPVLPNNVKIVFSSLQDDGTMEVFKNRDYPVFVLKKLRKEQRHRLVKEYLSRNFGKNLQETQIRRIIEDKQCENTLVLKTLLDEIICNGRHDILDQQISYYLGSDSVADFYERVIIRYEEDFGKEFVKMVLGLLAVSRNGLSEDQLITMARIKQLDWSAFYCSFSTHLNNQSGRLVFTHNFITRTVWNRYMEKDSAFENACRWTIVRGLIKVQDDNAMQEVPFQLDKLKDWDQLHDYIATYRYLVYCMDFDELEIGAYWRHIFSALSDRYSLTDYLQDRPSNDEDAVQMYIKLLRLCVVLYKIKPKKIFVDELNKIIEAHPELASAKVYQALSASLSGPDDGVTVDDALRYANLSLELCRKEHDTLGEIESLRLLGSCYYWLAVRAKREDCAKKAFDVWEEALHLSIALYGEVHPLVMHAYKDMGLMCDDLDKALELTLKAVELGKMIYGKDHPLLGRPYHYVGCIYREMKRWNEALHYFEEACRVWLPAYGLNHEIMVSSYGNQGKCLMNMNRYDEALKCYDTNLRILAAIYDKPTYDYAVTQLNRAKILLALGRKEESLQACDEIEATLKNESVSAEERSKDLEKYYKDFRKTIA